MKKRLLALALSACLLPGCTALRRLFSRTMSQPPDEVVKSFVQLSTSVGEEADRARLSQLCTGSLKQALDAMPSETFTAVYAHSGIDLRRFTILSSQGEKDEVTVSYEVTVRNGGGTDPTDETVRRDARLVLESGQWRIRELRMAGRDRISFSRGMIF